MSYASIQRITHIERPKSFLMKIAFMVMKRTLGKVITPAKVVYARYPKLLFLAKKMYDIQDEMTATSHELKQLIQFMVASINECDFCMDMKKHAAVKAHFDLRKFDDVLRFRDTGIYSDAERAVLEYVCQLTKTVKVSDECFQALARHFSEEAIIEITYTAASENYMNRITKPLGIGSDGFCSM